MSIAITHFDLFADLLKEKSGLALTADKSYLLESRLTPVAKEFNYDSIDAMGDALMAFPDPKMLEAIIDAMTTNETFFFRDNTPFDNFKECVLPYMKEHRANLRKMRIWCAAASSGQEPYSLAMILKEQAADFATWMLDIVGTDISADILDQARKGLYSQFEVQRGLPIQLLMSYFTQTDDGWQISDDIKSMVKYELFNLLDDPARHGIFDVIFCRNVLIYFDEATKTEVFAKLAKQLAPDGFLFLGGAETIIGLTEEFKPMPGRRGVYVKADSPHLAVAA